MQSFLGWIRVLKGRWVFQCEVTVSHIICVFRVCHGSLLVTGLNQGILPSPKACLSARRQALLHVLAGHGIKVIYSKSLSSKHWHRRGCILHVSINAFPSMLGANAQTSIQQTNTMHSASSALSLYQELAATTSWCLRWLLKLTIEPTTRCMRFCNLFFAARYY